MCEGVSHRGDRSVQGAQHSRPFATSIRPLALLNFGPDHLHRLRVLLQVYDLDRLVVSHLNEPPWLVRDFQPALPLQTLEDRVHQVGPARLQVGQLFESTHESCTDPEVARGPETPSPRWGPHGPV